VRLVFILFTLQAIAFNSHADDWMDYVNAGLEVLDKQMEHSEKPIEPRAALALPTDMPAHWQFKYVDEPVFHSKIVVLETGKQHQETILLVHGLGQLGFKDWLDVIPHLEKRYHVIAFDLPGFGLSQVPQGRYNPTNFALVVESIVAKFAKPKLTVIGHSMGGAISLRYAATNQQRLQKLILVDAAGILEKTAFIKSASKLPIDVTYLPGAVQKKIAQLNDFGAKMIEYGSINIPVSDILKNSDVVWRSLLSDAPNINAAVSLVEANFSQNVNQLTVATELIWGEDDPIAPLRTGIVLSKVLPNATLAIIEGAAHVPMKSHNKQFLNVLDQALERSNKQRPDLKPHSVMQDQLVCDNQQNQTYSGHYYSVSINNCINITIDNLTTNHLYIKDSLVNISNLNVSSPNTAIEIVGSTLKVTNGTISGKRALFIDDSRIDMAGVKLYARQQAAQIARSSTVIFSLSTFNNTNTIRHLHGAYRLSDQSLLK